MRSKIWLQALVALLVFLMWDTLRLKQDALADGVRARLGAVPVLVISDSSDELQHVAMVARALPMVNGVVGESPDQIARRLIGRIEESAGQPLDADSRNLLQSTPLPGMAHISVNPEKFSEQAKQSLWSALQSVRPDIVIRYNDENWRQRLDEIAHLLRIRLLYDVFFAILALLTAVILRVVFENRQDEYWRIVRRAGGDARRRRTQWWKNSLVMVALPSMVSLVVMVGYLRITAGAWQWPWTVAAMQAGCMAPAVYISWLAVREKLN